MLRLIGLFAWVALVCLMSLVFEGARVWLLVKPWKRLRQWRTRRKMRSWDGHHLDEVAEDFNSDETEASVSSDQVLGIVRHVLTTAGGGLVVGGYVSDAQLTAIVGGLVAVAGAVWSYWVKRKAA